MGYSRVELDLSVLQTDVLP